MLNRRFDREILALALPALGTLAADPLVTLVDTAFVGRLGREALAALGVNAAVFSTSFFLFIFLAYGTTPMVGRAIGRGDPDAAGRLVTQAFFLAAAVGLAVFSVLELFALPLLTLMGANESVLGPATTYLRIRALAAPAVLFITAGNGVFRGFQDTRTPFAITLSVSLLNLILDPLLIFGFGWGLAGAAWATVASQWLGAAGFVVLLLVVQRERYRVPLVVPGFRELAPLLRVGWELAVRTLSLLLVTTFATAVAARVGVVEVAAHQVAFGLWLFMALTVDALAVAAQALIARYVGEGKPVRARAVSDRLLLLGFVVGLALLAGFYLFEGVLPGLFTDDPEVIWTLRRVYPLVVLLQPLTAVVFVFDGIFMGVEAFAFLARAMAISAAVAGAVLALVLPLGWGLVGVWWGMVTLIVMRFLTLGWWYWGRGKRFAVVDRDRAAH